MLKPKEVESHTGTLNGVVSDLIRRLQHQRSRHGQHVVQDVAGEFYKFGLEGACLGQCLGWGQGWGPWERRGTFCSEIGDGSA